jgi:hypothetical protein
MAAYWTKGHHESGELNRQTNRGMGLGEPEWKQLCSSQRYAEAAGIQGHSVHSLRHSIAVHLLDAGRGIEYVADRLGHRNIQNSRIHAQISTHSVSRSSGTSSAPKDRSDRRVRTASVAALKTRRKDTGPEARPPKRDSAVAMAMATPAHLFRCFAHLPVLAGQLVS